MIDARTTEDGYPALREVFEEMTKAWLAIHAATLAHRMTVYLHSNWRGDVVMATDTAGNVVGEYAYTTFGEQLSATGTYTPRFSFSSKERDASGLVYFGFRYYSPVLCRWLSEDPIGEAGGINLYQFCGNNPVNGVDPYGEFTWSEWGEIGGAFAEGWSRGSQGVVNAFTGGLFNPQDGVFYDTFNEQWENLGYEPNDCNDNFQAGMTGGRVAVGAFAAAGALQAAGANPWLGKVEIHAAHAGGPHQFRHLQMMLRVSRHTTKHWRIPLP